MPLDGHGTLVTKLNAEAHISFNRGLVKDVGAFTVDEAGSGTYAADDDFVFDTVNGHDLVVRANSIIKSESPIGVTINGTKPGGGAIVGNATIAALVSEGQSYQVVVSGDFKFDSITSIVISGGLFGDGFDVLELPDSADDEEIKFHEGLNPSEGTTIKPIFDHYDLDHNKRVRGENKLTISALYVNALEGLRRIKNRDVTIRVDYHDDGNAGISEVVYYDQCRLGVSEEIPSAADGSVTSKAEGTFGRVLVFS